ncbi:unnamed protein product [Vitrella brassicaformis CCMP3155]|uniref:Uncharacterized protein n=1 Tax=Vitrella brassicaformis (strain CCMP3155) TaxID=1169540 RepID=A0A0G4EN50_VITBC|nr:unnamed protein product [Vitrella brassicaformis CCMP3155]|eukprot:CEL98541.1 unnamed protein product [Vitrella brassicaformis CCMP3155]
MDVSQFVANAQAVKDSLVHLQPIQDRIIARLSRLLEQDAASIAAQASSPEAWVLNHQLGSMASLLNALTTQLEQGEPGLAGAVDALTPTTEAAAAAGPQHTEALAPAVAGPSYRLIHKSGNAPIHQTPARIRLSRDELSEVFGHLQPWELTRHRRPLGTPLFHQSAANYTNLVIDCENDTARRMWETMPLAVAHRWGKRAANVREIKHRYPEDCDCWCRGTWVAVVEGHAFGRAAIADKKRQERKGGEGAAAAAAGRDDDRSQSADEGTLEVLSFEEFRLFFLYSIRIPHPPPSSEPLPAPSAPVHLPALTTVVGLSVEFAPLRIGRSWCTPNLTSLAIDRGFVSTEAVKPWISGCESLEEIDLGGIEEDGEGEELVEVLRVLSPSNSLSSLRSLKPVKVWQARAHHIDRLRDTLVGRGVNRTLCHMGMDILPGDDMRNDDGTRIRIEKVADLAGAVMHPDALASPQSFLDTDYQCSIAAELVSWGCTHRRPLVRAIVGHLAAHLGQVVYSGGEETAQEGTAAAATCAAGASGITDGTFPEADTLELESSALATPEKQERAADIAACMRKLTTVLARTSPAEPDAIVPFLRALQSHYARTKTDRTLTLDLRSIPSATLTTAGARNGLELGRHAAHLPAIEKVTFHITGDVTDADFDAFYGNVMAVVASSTKLRGHKETSVTFFGHTTVGRKVACRFRAQHSLTGLCSNQFDVECDRFVLQVKRRG